MRHVAPRMRVRRGRVFAALVSSTTVAVTVLGAAGMFGVQPLGAPDSASTSDDALAGRNRAVVDRSERLENVVETTESAEGSGPSAASTEDEKPAEPVDKFPLPKHSGAGKRVVYTLKENHVWLVDRHNEVVREYPVSGTRFGQVDPDTYSVIRKRPETTSYHGTETMRYMVTFTEGENAAIGFHDIPITIETGEPIQTRAQLGTSLSDGCVRQARADARALWKFAPVGTEVVVLP